MNQFVTILLLLSVVSAPPPAAAQDLLNQGVSVLIQPGAVLSVGTGGLANRAGATLANAGTLRVLGPLRNAGAIDLRTGSLEVRGDLTNTGSLLPGTGTVTFSGAADQLLTAGGATLYQVLLNKPTAGANTLRLAGDLTVSHQLSLANGLLSTLAGTTLSTLRLPDGATLTGEAPGRYVLGALQITRNAVRGAAVDFGHGVVLDPTSNDLGAVAITRTAGLNLASVSFGQNMAATAQGIDRIWTVSPTTQPSAAVQLSLNWTADNDHGLSDFTQSRMWQQAAAGQSWAPVGLVASAAGRTLRMSPLVLNRFTISNAANPLPVRPELVAGAGFAAYPTQVAVGQNATFRYAGPAGPATLQVFDLVGRRVRQATVDGQAQGEVPLAGLAIGVYLLRYTTATAGFTARCVVE